MVMCRFALTILWYSNTYKLLNISSIISIYIEMFYYSDLLWKCQTWNMSRILFSRTTNIKWYLLLGIFAKLNYHIYPRSLYLINGFFEYDIYHLSSAQSIHRIRISHKKSWILQHKHTHCIKMFENVLQFFVLYNTVLKYIIIYCNTIDFTIFNNNILHLLYYNVLHLQWN